MSIPPAPVVRWSRWSPWLLPLVLHGCAVAGVTPADSELRRDAPGGFVTNDSAGAPSDAGVVAADASDGDSAKPDARVPVQDGAGDPGTPDADVGSDAGVQSDGGVEGDDPVVDAGRDSGAPVPVVDAGSDDGGDAPVAMADAAPEIDAGLPDPDPTEDLGGEGDGSDVITIGDSWMKTNVLLAGGGIQGGLDRAGTRYRHYAEPLVLLLEDNRYGAAIPAQWDRAVAEDADIQTVIMTAGGTDVYADSACNSQAGCQQLFAAIVAELNTLWADMAESGVRDVVYVAYSADVGSGVTADVEANGIAEACRKAPLRCQVLETTDIVAGQLTIDGVVPAAAATDRIAAGILGLLRDVDARR